MRLRHCLFASVLADENFTWKRSNRIAGDHVPMWTNSINGQHVEKS